MGRCGKQNAMGNAVPRHTNRCRRQFLLPMGLVAFALVSEPYRNRWAVGRENLLRNGTTVQHWHHQVRLMAKDVDVRRYKLSQRWAAVLPLADNNKLSRPSQ